MKICLRAGAILLGIVTAVSGQGASDSSTTATLSHYVVPSELAPLPKSSFASTSQPTRDIQNTVWITSMCAALGASAMDAATSWGKTEKNPLLASGNGSFAGKGVAIKAGLAAGLLVPQLLLHKHKELKTAFTVGNFAEAGLFSAAAIHNTGVAKPQ